MADAERVDPGGFLTHEGARGAGDAVDDADIAREQVRELGQEQGRPQVVQEPLVEEGTRIGGLADLEGRALGIINDPSAYATLEAAGLRWGGNLSAKGRRIATLGSLIPMTDQGRIHDALADGVVDAFAVDAPIMHWACTSPDSPWRGRIEILPGNLAPSPWFYAAAVADHPSSCRLLMAVDAFLDGFIGTAERAAIERRWQGNPVAGSGSYRDEPGNLRGSPDLVAAYRAQAGHEPLLPDLVTRRRAA